LLVQNDSKWVVADAFGGNVAVVDVARAEIESVRDLPAHNIRGLALSAGGDEVLIAHQRLASLAQTTRDDIHWGNLLTNSLRTIPLAELLTPAADLVRHGRLTPLGGVGEGAADPAGVVSLGKDVMVALAGVGEVAVRRNGEWQRIKVGRRPTAVARIGNTRQVLVANTFDDSVSLIDMERGDSIAAITLGPQPPLSAPDRGEISFFDGRLSHDGWLSCHSCHTDGHTNGRVNDNLGDSSFGAPKRVLSLLGAKDTGPWSWTGEASELEGQIQKSLRSTMHGPELPKEQARRQSEDIAAFVRTLKPPPAATGDEAAVEKGKEIFQRNGCATCHAPPTYTTPKSYDVGMRDEVGNDKFNPPSLRGVRHGTSFFHDNRASSLEEVFTKHRHQLKEDLAEDQVRSLVEFLRTL
jgi:hypothetical protein